MTITCTVCHTEKAKSQMRTSTVCKACAPSTEADSEVEAIRQAYTALAKIDPEAQRRAVSYLAARFNCEVAA